MLRIVEVRPSATAGGEYVVLQNQGLTTISLLGWTLTTDSHLYGDAAAAAPETFIFAYDVPLKPYGRLVLFTGAGEDGWCPTTDGKYAYLIHWNRPSPVWSRAGYVHLLQPVDARKVVRPESAELVPA